MKRPPAPPTTGLEASALTTACPNTMATGVGVTVAWTNSGTTAHDVGLLIYDHFGLQFFNRDLDPSLSRVSEQTNSKAEAHLYATAENNATAAKNPHYTKLEIALKWSLRPAVSGIILTSFRYLSRLTMQSQRHHGPHSECSSDQTIT